MKSTPINLRAQPEQRALIDRAADMLGKNRSDFMLESACARARDVLLDQVFFSLDADGFSRFTELLERPTHGNAGLAKLMAVDFPWNQEAS